MKTYKVKKEMVEELSEYFKYINKDDENILELQTAHTVFRDYREWLKDGSTEYRQRSARQLGHTGKDAKDFLIRSFKTWWNDILTMKSVEGEIIILEEPYADAIWSMTEAEFDKLDALSN